MKNLKKQIRRANYLENIFFWKINQDGTRYRDVQGMELKAVKYAKEMSRLLEERKKFPQGGITIEFIKNLRKYQQLNQLLNEIIDVLSGEITIEVPVSYQVVKTVNSKVKISLAEYNYLTNKNYADYGLSPNQEHSKWEVFQNVEERAIKNVENYLHESFNVLDRTY
jgi:hypothetical protein